MKVYFIPSLPLSSEEADLLGYVSLYLKRLTEKVFVWLGVRLLVI